MGRQPEFSSRREQQLFNLIRSGLDEEVAATSLLLLDEAVLDEFLPEGAPASERAALLCWLVRQTATEEAEAWGWISSEDRLPLIVLARLRPELPKDYGARRRVLGMQLSAGTRDSMGDRQLRRRRSEMVAALDSLIFDRPLNDQGMLGILIGRWHESHMPILTRRKFAGGLHKQQQFILHEIVVDYHLDPQLRAIEYIDRRVMVPAVDDIRFWSTPVLYSAGNELLIPHVTGDARFYGLIEQSEDGNYRRYAVEFSPPLKKGGTPVVVELSYDFSRVRSETEEPVPTLAMETAFRPSEASYRLTVHFSTPPQREVRKLRGPVSGWPHSAPDDEYAFDLPADQIDPRTFRVTSDGLHSNYRLSLYWPRPESDL